MFRRNPRTEIEGQLHRSRPRPSNELVHKVEAKISRASARRSGRIRLGSAVALSAALAIAVSFFGATSYAASGASGAVHAVRSIFTAAQPHAVGSVSAAADQYHKVTICHKGHTIRVNEHSVPAHLAHGDTFGRCPKPEKPIHGGKGNDDFDYRKSHKNLVIIDGRGNNDVHTGYGDDYVRTGSGKDAIRVGTGNNRVLSGGNDKIRTGKGHNTINAGSGNDWIWIRNGESEIYVDCGPGKDVVYADSKSIDFVAKNCEIVPRGNYRSD